MASNPRFILTLEALPSSVPVSARLKRLLKYALRSQGIRCVTIVPVTSRPKPDQQAIEAAGGES